jgi:hypothetical protein
LNWDLSFQNLSSYSSYLDFHHVQLLPPLSLTRETSYQSPLIPLMLPSPNAAPDSCLPWID